MPKTKTGNECDFEDFYHLNSNFDPCGNEFATGARTGSRSTFLPETRSGNGKTCKQKLPKSSNAPVKVSAHFGAFRTRSKAPRSGGAWGTCPPRSGSGTRATLLISQTKDLIHQFVCLISPIHNLTSHFGVQIRLLLLLKWFSVYCQDNPMEFDTHL